MATASDNKNAIAVCDSSRGVELEFDEDEENANVTQYLPNVD